MALSVVMSLIVGDGQLLSIDYRSVCYQLIDNCIDSTAAVIFHSAGTTSELGCPRPKNWNSPGIRHSSWKVMEM